MITIKHPADLPDTYLLERIGALWDLLFFDIETIGFSGDTSQLHLIDCICHDGSGWGLVRWSADIGESEVQPLTTFFTFMEQLKVLVHFSGDGFDILYLLRCCRRLGLDCNPDNIASVDIYKKVKSYRRLLGLENMKRKSIEQFLGVSRENKYFGGQLIEVYRDYLVTHESFLYDLLILHNKDDLKGMPSVLPILDYTDMTEAPLALDSQQLYCADDISSPFLNLIWRNPYFIPAPLKYDTAPVSLELHRDVLTCNTALYQGELKYFYPNYRDYYYLPSEDTTVHKSVGEHVDRDARKKAVARTCYSKKCGLSLPQFGPLWPLCLKKGYKVSLDYVIYSPDLLSDSDSADSYARQILDYISRKREA